jgi:hypothetical protein
MTPEAAVSVIVPSLDEAQNLEEVLPKIPSQYELIIVEGARFHRTTELVRSLRPDARVIGQTRYGKGNAVACGFAAATGDIIVMFDADGSADPAEITRFVQAVSDGAMFAKGTRSRGGGSDDITHLRNAGNVGLTLLTNLMFGVRYTDLCYGYNALHRDLLPLLDLPDTEPVGGAPLIWPDFSSDLLPRKIETSWPESTNPNSVSVPSACSPKQFPSTPACMPQANTSAGSSESHPTHCASGITKPKSIPARGLASQPICTKRTVGCAVKWQSFAKQMRSSKLRAYFSLRNSTGHERNDHVH